MFYKKEKNILLKNREEILTGFMILICLVLFTFFPAEEPLEKITSGIVSLFLLPVLYLKLILKKNLRNFGLQTGDWKNGLIFSAIALLAILSIYFLFNKFTGFAASYFLPLPAKIDFLYFLFYELVIVGIFIALHEFFFRGFVLSSFKERLGKYSVFLQFFLVFGFFLITGSLDWNNMPFVLVALFSGITAYKSNSVLYSAATSLLSIIILDALIIKFIY